MRNSGFDNRLINNLTNFDTELDTAYIRESKGESSDLFPVAFINAIVMDDFTTFKTYVESGIITYVDPDSRTTLHYVEKQTGNNAAHYAAKHNRVDMFDYISNIPGFNKNQLNNDGDSYLHVAAANNHRDMVEYLINKHNIALSIANVHGYTAEQVARDRGHKHLADYLARRAVLPEEKAQDGAENTSLSPPQNQIMISRPDKAVKPLSGPGKFMQFVLEGRKPNVTKIPNQQNNQENVSNIWQDLSFTPKTAEELQIVLSQPGKAKYTSLDLSKLHSLSPNQSNIEADLLKIIDKFPELNSLEFGNHIKISEAGLAIIATNMRNLTTLGLVNHYNLSGPIIETLATNLPNLTSLRFPGGYFENIVDADTGILFEDGNEFNFVAPGRDAISDTDLINITNNLQNLTSLDLGFYRKITDIGIKAISTNLHNLRYLNLPACELLTDIGVVNIANHLKKLTVLNLSRLPSISDGGIFSLVLTGMPALTSLNISYCRNITDAGIGCISGHMPGLTSLNVSKCENITDEGIKKLVRIPGLTSLNLRGCTRITDDGIKSIATMPGLTSLNLQGCVQTTADGIKAIATNMPQLEKLTLVNIVINEKSFKQIAKMHNLTYLDISHCSQVTDNMLKLIAKKMPGLTCLNLSNCENITNTGIGYLAKMSNLRHLNCNMQGLMKNDRENPNLTFYALSKLKNSLPSTNIIGIDGSKLSPQQSVIPEYTYYGYGTYAYGYGTYAIMVNRDSPKDNITNIIQSRQNNQELSVIPETTVSREELSFIPETVEEIQNVLSQPGKAKYTSLNLSKLNIEAFHIDDLYKIIDKFPDLTALEFGNRIKLSKNGLAIITTYMPNLTALGLVNYNIPNAIENIATNLPNLTSLRFPGGFFVDNVKDRAKDNTCVPGLGAVMDTDVTHLTKLRKLTSLDLGFYLFITDAAIKDIATNLPDLRSISLPFCSEITDNAVQSIANNCKHLTHLNIALCHKITEFSTYELNLHSKELTSLNISDCQKLQGNGITFVTNMRSLTSLDLRDISSINNDDIKSIANMRNLTSLKLKNCPLITQNGIKRIADKMPQLKELTLENIIIEKDSFKKIADMHQLTHLNVSHCQITDDILEMIARKMPGLTHLNLSNCPEITDIGIRHLANMPNLSHLKCNMQNLIEQNEAPDVSNNALLMLNYYRPQTKIIGIDGQTISPPERNYKNYMNLVNNNGSVDYSKMRM